jgi:predicted acylesterase/phospholipase RssA
MKFDLVFEGGGAKGMVFVGAMQEFENRGHLHDRLLGTSAGAITAALMAAGYSSQEMLAALDEKKDGHSVFADFMGAPTPPNEADVQRSAIYSLLKNFDAPWIPNALENKLDFHIALWLGRQVYGNHLFSFVDRGGWYSADNFLAWIKKKMDSGELNGKPRSFSEMTLKQFFKATQKDLSLVASDTTAGEMLVLNHRTAPKLPVVWAVRMSMSIPLLWQEVVWQTAWGTYLGKKMSGHTIVDGGLLSNFPIELFLSDLDTVTKLMGPKRQDNVMGFLIDETMKVKGISSKSSQASKGIKLGSLQTVQRLNNLVNTVLGARDKNVIETFEKLVVRMPAKGFGTTEFDMSESRKKKLVSAGREAMKSYLNRIEAPEAVSFAIPEVLTRKKTADRMAQNLLAVE